MIFNYACDLPIFTMNYRNSHSGDKSDQQLVDEQIMAVKAGANMIDLMGDMFDPSPLELTPVGDP
ncbi:hypothetical protein B1748_04920 [Paenibacillus sp. MY03]|uniref:hypothetical protein n=1 Tax=Paenibacillus sp. MY03 TaxID=302980 RepID=UPI000B3C3B19|nr:hypothetical protein [Paenibacillus sp. MY03]OUS78108.1 hypothetical protein B1748_04920 [Paenibacillus sp. MY03]